jgi:predicted patatin/cPLA2 family phospholipase
MYQNSLKDAPVAQPVTALIVEGAATRGIFSAGVLDCFLERGFEPFDLYIGISSGAYNLLAYLKGQYGISREITLALKSNGVLDIRRYIQGGDLIDLDQLQGQIFRGSRQQMIYDLDVRKPFYIVTTDVNSGQARYDRVNKVNLRTLLKASASLPVICREFIEYDGRMLTDGGIADGIPVAKAIQMGARKIVIIRARHGNYIKQDTLVHRYIRWKMRHHSALLATMQKRISIFESSIALLRKPPDGIEILEICPPESFSAGRFSSDQASLLHGYYAGYGKAEDVMQTFTSSHRQAAERSAKDQFR